MTARISHISIDCHNAYTLSEWWKEMLGFVDLADDPNSPGDEECMIHDPKTGEHLLFLEVPNFDDSIEKRIHFDLRPRERTQADELEVLIGLGARQIADHRGIYGPGTGWVILADPEGNQFCILRGNSEL